MTQKGYYRFPSIHNEKAVFISEMDLWTVHLPTGDTKRITSDEGDISHCVISPNGKWIAYSSNQEGYQEIYCIPFSGGIPKRITFLGARSIPVKWSSDSQTIFISSNFQTAFESFIYKISLEGGEPIKENIGPATQLDFDAKGKMIIGKHTGDPARWKRYKGGTAGEFWIRKKNGKKFHKILDHLNANITCPILIKEKVFFISDYEGIGNLYSSDLNGKKINRHSDSDTYYIRNASSDGKSIIYHAGADLYVYDIAKNKNNKINVKYYSSKMNTQRRFVEAKDFLQVFDLHPEGAYTAIASRGKMFSFANWSGPVQQHGKMDGIRYRLPTWLQDKKTLLTISDEINGEDRPILFKNNNRYGTLLKSCDIGRAHEIVANPEKNSVAIINHRNELLVLDVNQKKLNLVDKSNFDRIGRPSWSPNGIWLCYSYVDSGSTEIIKLANTNTGRTYEITSSVLSDHSPIFSPDGKFIYFIGNREFHPVYDAVKFDLSFHNTNKIYAITLQKDQKSPFISEPQSPSGSDKDEPKNKNKKDSKKFKIDLTGIQDRIFEFPISRGNYSQLQAFDKKVYFLDKPEIDNVSGHKMPDYDLNVFDFEKLNSDTLYSYVNAYKLSLTGEDMIVRTEHELRVMKTGDKPNDDEFEKYGIRSGWLNLDRVKISLNVQEEWKQMYREAWLLQREHFWNSNMSGIDWTKVYHRYWKLLDRVGSRGEFSDIIWEMQGELGTSHCYEFGGDYEYSSHYGLGKLGCTYKQNAKNEYIFDEIFSGDPAKNEEISPLITPHANLKSGDKLLEVNGHPVGPKTSPRELLVNTFDEEVLLTIQRKGQKKREKISIKTLAYESDLLYRAWVEKNREYVHKKSKGKVGYVHIPDMGVRGFSEFHRYFLTECRFDSLLVDVRYNGGGHVSQLILEKLNRVCLGYDQPRWSIDAEPYPSYTIQGPIACLTNEFAGSDGDIFSHSFKMMKIGKLLGKRTWGGVIGINSQYSLSDGAITTQPEYSFWFNDVGWEVENYGTDPDIEIEISPEDHANGIDTQLESSVQFLLKELKKQPVIKPNLGNRPNLSLPQLPKRK